jgi:hypothetical protein
MKKGGKEKVRLGTIACCAAVVILVFSQGNALGGAIGAVLLVGGFFMVVAGRLS